MSMSPSEAWNLYPFERKWYIKTFVEHRTKENEAIG